MLSMNPYFNFQGNAGEAMNFYKMTLGGEFITYQRFRDMPGCEKMPAEEQDMFMHISLKTPGGLLLMATDALKSMEQNILFGNNNYVCVHTESEEETDRLFNHLSEGGKIEMPVNKTFWGAYCGMLRDKFGVQWLLNYTYPQN